MSSPLFEAFLARIYVDQAARDSFLRDPVGAARLAGLTTPECTALASIDRAGLLLAATSFERKRGLRPDGRR